MCQPGKITISPHLTFDALVAGEVGGPLVLPPHGFAESVCCGQDDASVIRTKAGME
jgi:hypothetical protein